MSANAPRGRRASISEINVTPLVDVMLVLLIIFMVTAPMMQQGLEVDLPETTASGMPTSDEPFILVISKSGQLSIGNSHLPMGELRKKVAAIFRNKKSKEVYIQADRNTSYGVVAEAMAELRAAGIYNISLVTLPKGGR